MFKENEKKSTEIVEFINKMVNVKKYDVTRKKKN